VGDKISKAINQLRRDKAPGVCNITQLHRTSKRHRGEHKSVAHRVIKPRRGGSQTALQEIEHAVCLYVCPSVRLTLLGSQTTKTEGLNLEFH